MPVTEQAMSVMDRESRALTCTAEVFMQDAWAECGKRLCCATHDAALDELTLAKKRPCGHCRRHFAENVEAM